jgi:hypothetical protein
MQIRLLGQSTRHVEHHTSNGVNITSYVYDDPFDKEDAVTFVYSLPRTAADRKSYLQGEPQHYAQGLGYTLHDQGTVRFRGHPGSTGTFTDAVNLNGQYTLLVLDWSSTRAYMFFGPSGEPFNDMMASFQPLG